MKLMNLVLLCLACLACPSSSRRVHSTSGYLSGVHRSDQLRHHSQVAVVGGGLGGLALTIGLLEAGVDVVIYEKADQLRDASKGVISIWPNGMKALRALHPDIPHELSKAGAAYARNATLISRSSDAPAGPNKVQRDGSSRFLSMKENFGMDAMFAAWTDVQRVLAARVPDDHIRFGKHLEHMEEANDSIKLTFSDGSEATALVAIGADGTFSTTRRLLQDVGQLPQTGAVRFFGQTNWASILKGYQDRFLQVTKEEGRIVMLNVAGDPPISFYFCSIGDDRTFWQVRATDNERTFRHTSETGRLGAPGAKQQILELVRDIPEIKAAVEATPEGEIYERSIYDLHPPLPRFVAGRVALMGDAAHAPHTLPGQGANFAFEDAAELSWLLGRQGSGSDDLKLALEAYQAARIERCHHMQMWAAESGEGQKKGGGATATPEEMQQRTVELYGWQPPHCRDN